MNAEEMFEAIGYRKHIKNGYIKFEVEGIIVCNLEDKIERLHNYIEHLKEVLKDFEGGE